LDLCFKDYYKTTTTTTTTIKNSLNTELFIKRASLKKHVFFDVMDLKAGNTAVTNNNVYCHQ
jgi:hypothetical protein